MRDKESRGSDDESIFSPYNQAVDDVAEEAAMSIYKSYSEEFEGEGDPGEPDRNWLEERLDISDDYMQGLIEAEAEVLAEENPEFDVDQFASDVKQGVLTRFQAMGRDRMSSTPAAPTRMDSQKAAKSVDLDLDSVSAQVADMVQQSMDAAEPEEGEYEDYGGELGYNLEEGVHIYVEDVLGDKFTSLPDDEKVRIIAQVEERVERQLNPKRSQKGKE